MLDNFDDVEEMRRECMGLALETMIHGDCTEDDVNKLQAILESLNDARLIYNVYDFWSSDVWLKYGDTFDERHNSSINNEKVDYSTEEIPF